MKAPFPYFGGKSRIAKEVWERFGNVPNFVEPFCGSAAVLLARPNSHAWWDRIETVNDADAMISNYWRSTQQAPEEVAKWADWPCNESDLHARHAWLIDQKESLQATIEGNPDYYDAKIAGWWLWGICLWIGSGWCSGQGPWQSVDGKLVHLRNAGQGINRQMVHLGGAGQGINRKRVHLGNAEKGHAAAWSEQLRTMMQGLADRLRRVRVCAGDWTRVCGPTPTFVHGVTGVFLDPPYSGDAGRDMNLYAVESPTVAAAVRRWCLANGDNPLLRIALCGYSDTPGMEMPTSWEAVAWRAAGGYGAQGNGRARENSTRETVWFSPSCLRPNATLFGWAGMAN